MHGYIILTIKLNNIELDLIIHGYNKMKTRTNKTCFTVKVYTRLQWH